MIKESQCYLKSYLKCWFSSLSILTNPFHYYSQNLKIKMQWTWSHSRQPKCPTWEKPEKWRRFAWQIYLKFYLKCRLLSLSILTNPFHYYLQNLKTKCDNLGHGVSALEDKCNGLEVTVDNLNVQLEKSLKN